MDIRDASVPKDGGPAFPSRDVAGDSSTGSHVLTTHGGMTMRQWYKGQALVGLLALTGVKDTHLGVCADKTGKIADAMVAEDENAGY